MSDRPWSDALSEWVYGPARDEGDEPLSVGEMYRIQEEELRIKWIPGYRELVERYLDALHAWHAAWRPGEEYPPKPPELDELEKRISLAQRERARAPWEAEGEASNRRGSP